MAYWGRLDTEEKRLAYREYEVAGFDLTHYEDEKTDIYTKEENERYYLKIFNGTAGKPSCYYSFRSEQAREKYISDYLEGRRRHFERINARVDAMMEMGLEQEARSVYHLRHYNSLNTVGFKEMFAYFDGTMDYLTARERIKKNTRVYAKKQLTWYAKDPLIQWLHPAEAKAQVMKMLSKNLT